MYSLKERTGTYQSVIIAAQKRSGSNFVTAVVDTTPLIAVQEPIGLHKSSLSPLYPWNYSGKEHVSEEFGHSALAASPYAAAMTKNAISWIQEGGKIVKETDPLYLEWLLTSLHNVKLITLSRDMRASIASFKSNHLYEKWGYEDKMSHLAHTLHSTKILENLYGGLFPKDFVLEPEMRQLAFYYSLVVGEIGRTTFPFNPLKIDYEDLIDRSESTFRRIFNHMEVPWNDKTSKALGKLKSETRKVGPHSTYLRPEDRSDFRNILTVREEADIRAIAHDFGIDLDTVHGIHSVSPHQLKYIEKKHEYDEVKSSERRKDIDAIRQGAISIEIEGDPILVAKTVTTNKQYATFLQSLVDNNIPLVIDGEPLFYHERQHGIQYKDGHIYIDKELENHPVNFVNWIGASIYAAWLGGRLPTGKEWKSAIVGGEDNIPNLLAGANIDQKIGNTTHVEKFPPHESGLHDPIGNVSIWLDEGSSQYERIKAGLEWGHGEERGLYNPRPFWLGNSGLGIRPVFSQNSLALPDTDFYTKIKSFVDMIQIHQSEGQKPNDNIFDAIHQFFSYNEGVWKI